VLWDLLLYYYSTSPTTLATSATATTASTAAATSAAPYAATFAAAAAATTTTTTATDAAAKAPIVKIDWPVFLPILAMQSSTVCSELGYPGWVSRSPQPLLVLVVQQYLVQKMYRSLLTALL
jgi:hypothetical protein